MVIKRQQGWSLCVRNKYSWLHPQPFWNCLDEKVKTREFRLPLFPNVHCHLFFIFPKHWRNTELNIKIYWVISITSSSFKNNNKQLKKKKTIHKKYGLIPIIYSFAYLLRKLTGYFFFSINIKITTSLKRNDWIPNLTIEKNEWLGRVPTWKPRKPCIF